MKKKALVLAVVLLLCLSAVLGGCGRKDLSTLKEVSWEGTELTVSLGENKGTGCIWDTKIADDKVIDFSINRVFKLQFGSSEGAGTLEAGFVGVGEGTTTITCTTPVSWDGKGEGLTYIVTVTVNADGTIKSAEIN